MLPLTPTELAQADMRMMQEAAANHASSIVRSLKLKWFTPEWAREDRYKMVNFASGSQFIVRPATPGKEVSRWEAIYNGQRKAWVTGTLWDACLWLERSMMPTGVDAQAPQG